MNDLTGGESSMEKIPQLQGATATAFIEAAEKPQEIAVTEQQLKIYLALTKLECKQGEYKK